MTQPWTPKELESAIATLGKFSRYSDAVNAHNIKWKTGRSGDSISAALERNGKGKPSDYLRPARRVEDMKEPDKLRAMIDYLNRRKGSRVSVAEVCNHLDIAPQRLDALVGMAQALNYKVRMPVADTISLDHAAPPKDRRSVINIPIEPVNGVITFVAASDPHNGSLQARPECMKDALEYAYNEHGAKTVFWSGDMLDGIGVYTGQHTELLDHTMEAQVNRAVREIPQMPGMVHHAIGGNHDEDFLKKCGADALASLAHERKDIKIHGYYMAQIDAGPEDNPQALKVQLFHPGGGIPYSRSYRIQEAANKIPGGMKPHILLSGHLHYELTMFYRGIFCVQVPCFQDQTLLGTRMGSAPEIGLFVIKVGLTKGGNIKTINAERVMYFHSARGPVRCEVVDRNGRHNEKHFERRVPLD